MMRLRCHVAKEGGFNGSANDAATHQERVDLAEIPIEPRDRDTDQTIVTKTIPSP
jgi:hypothetical protein